MMYFSLLLFPLFSLASLAHASIEILGWMELRLQLQRCTWRQAQFDTSIFVNPSQDIPRNLLKADDFSSADATVVKQIEKPHRRDTRSHLYTI